MEAGRGTWVDMERKRVPVVIIGAGLTGLSASYQLLSMGIEHRVLERAEEPGGLSTTSSQDGFRFDKTGHLLHLRDPQISALVRGLLGNQLVSIERRSMVWSHGGYTRYPYQANTFGLPAEVAYECVMGFLEALRAGYGGSASEPSNFEEFCVRHFGDGFSRHFMIPYNCRLWGVHPQEITAQWCTRFVPIPTVEDVIAGAVGYGRRQLGYNAKFYYPRTGIGALPQALSNKVACVEYGKCVESVDVENRRVVLSNGDVVDYDVLINTMPLDRLIGMMRVPDRVREAASRLRCSSLQYLDVALDVPCGHPHHWVYVPEARYPFYRVGVYSNFSPDMAPCGKSCMYIELADRGVPDLGSLVPEVAAGLVEMGFIDSPNQLLFANHRTIEHAYVIYDHAYQESVNAVQQYLGKVMVFSTGRYGGWDYSSMEDAMMYGCDIANKVKEVLP